MTGATLAVVVWDLLGVAGAVIFWCLLVYALVKNPRWGRGESRVLALSVLIPFGIVVTFAVGLALTA